MNYLVSLRNSINAEGKPGPDFPDPIETSYISLGDFKPDYRLIGDDVVTKEAWVAQVKANANGGPVILFVHGFHNDSANVVTIHDHLKLGLIERFGEKFCLTSFDWPTGDKIWQSGIVYNHDWKNAATSGPYLVSECIEALLEAGIERYKIQVLTHSMGRRVAEIAFQNTPPAKSIGHIMLAAADVDAANFEAESAILANFLSHCSRFTCYYSKKDEALQYSAKYHHEGLARLGQVGFTEAATNGHGQCVSVNCTEYYDCYVYPDDRDPEMSHKWYLTPRFDEDFLSDIHNVMIDAEYFPTRKWPVSNQQVKLVKPNSEQK